MNLTNFFLELWFTLFPLIGFIAILTLPWLPFVIWKKLIPKASRTLFWAKRQRKIPIVVVHDSGRAEIDLAKERLGHGILITDKKKFKLVPRFVSKIDYEALDEALKDENPLKLKEVIGKFIRDYSDWITKRAYLIDLGLPIYFGYSGIMCLLNPESLALYEAGELAVETADKTLFNPNKLPNKSIKKALEPLMLLDPRKIKNIISEGFDEAQISAVVRLSEEIGRMSVSFGRYLPIVAIIVIIMVVILGIAFLPNLLQGVI